MQGRILILTIFLFLPGIAQASDPTGLASFFYLFVITPLFTATNMGLMIYFYSNGRYSDRSFAIKHTCIGAFFPLIGCLLSVLDNRDGHDLLFTLGLNSIALLLAFTPLLLGRKK